MLIMPGFDDKVGRPFFQAFDRQVYIRIGRDHNNRLGRFPFFNFFQPEQPFVACIDGTFEVHIQQNHIYIFIM